MLLTVKQTAFELESVDSLTGRAEEKRVLRRRDAYP